MNIVLSVTKTKEEKKRTMTFVNFKMLFFHWNLSFFRGDKLSTSRFSNFRLISAAQYRTMRTVWSTPKKIGVIELLEWYRYFTYGTVVCVCVFWLHQHSCGTHFYGFQMIQMVWQITHIFSIHLNGLVLLCTDFKIKLADEVERKQHYKSLMKTRPKMDEVNRRDTNKPTDRETLSNWDGCLTIEFHEFNSYVHYWTICQLQMI